MNCVQYVHLHIVIIAIQIAKDANPQYYRSIHFSHAEDLIFSVI